MSFRIMASKIPWIRAAAVVPMVVGLRQGRRPTESYLREADLDFVDPEHPEALIPLLNAAQFLRLAMQREGADVGCRAVDRLGVTRLSWLGAGALMAGTPRRALWLASRAMDLHCPHQVIQMAPCPGGVVVRESRLRRWDPETHHILNQYTASLIQALCALTGSCWPHVGSVSLAPHPDYGVEHLSPWLGERVTASTTPVMEIEIADRVLDAPLRIEGVLPLAPVPAGEWTPIAQDMSLIGSLKLVLAAMLRGGTPTIERLARAANVSVRTLQRRLQDEGSSFSRLLDDTRRELALRAICSGPASLAEVAEGLGYSQQSSLSRSVRRWSGTSPRDLRLPEETS